MITIEIYIKLIDGTESFVPVNCKELQNGNFIILKNKIFENLDYTELFEFYPDDIVRLQKNNFSNGTSGYVANKLVKAGNFPDRNFREFMFLVLGNKIGIDKDVLTKYNTEINRIKKERDSGKFLYPQLEYFINQLDDLK